MRFEMHAQWRGRLKLLEDIFERRLLERPGTRAREREKILIVHSGPQSERYRLQKQLFLQVAVATPWSPAVAGAAD